VEKNAFLEMTSSGYNVHVEVCVPLDERSQKLRLGHICFASDPQKILTTAFLAIQQQQHQEHQY